MSFRALEGIATIVIAVGGLAAIGGYLLSRFKGGVDRAEVEAIHLLRETAATLREQKAELERTGIILKEKLANCEGQVEALSKKNTELQMLVMGEKVPEAMANFITDSTAATNAAFLGRIEVAERVIVSAMSAQVADFKDAIHETFSPLIELLQEMRQEMKRERSSG